MIRSDSKHDIFTINKERPYLNLAAQMCNFAYAEYDYEFFESDWGEYVWLSLGAPSDARITVIDYLKQKRAFMTCPYCKNLTDVNRKFLFCKKRKKTIKENTFCIFFRAKTK